MNRFGFARVTVCSPVVTVGNPGKNMDSIIAMLDRAADSDVVVFPELCVSGYTCNDLFRQRTLFEAVEAAVLRLCQHCHSKNQLVLVGAPVPVGNELFNCAIAIQGTKILGIVPKQNIPNYAEFYESRWFRQADGDEPKEVVYNSLPVPFGTDLLFKWSCHGSELIVGVEICEDLWMPIPPSSYQSLAGANLLCNLSASNETVAKNEYRTQLVANQSGRCVSGYAYASAGPTESTTDLVFGGHCLIAENGHILDESSRVGQVETLLLYAGDRMATADIDTQKLQTERRLLTSFGDASRSMKRTFRTISFTGRGELNGLRRKVDGRPFVPKDPRTLKARCAEVFGIQCAGLAKRLQQIGVPNIVIGVSGGLDSTLALLVASKTLKLLGENPAKIIGVTMPGFGTTASTKQNALDLMSWLGVTQHNIDIRAACLQMFKDIRHDPFGIGMFHSSVELDKFGVTELEQTLRHIGDERRAKGDLVFENVQARHRTAILFAKGFVLGTGDLSELALGWCTYNGDHMSSYNVNCSIPKTLVKWLVRYVAETQADELDWLGQQEHVSNRLHNTLMAITNTTISPELLPPDAKGEIAQSTEDALGPYDLHDFYLSCLVRSGFSPDKILYLSDHADFGREYTREVREKTLRTFLTRFFANQFKRSCVPDGPKVGSVSLSPRGDWRMPSDADVTAWTERIK